jgi:hypothetical protein
MFIQDYAFYATVLIVVCFTLGFLIGGRLESRYWASHDNDGSVHHHGKFYRVMSEDKCTGECLIDE